MKTTKNITHTNLILFIVVSLLLTSCALPFNLGKSEAPQDETALPSMNLNEALLTTVNGQVQAKLPTQATFSSIMETIILPVQSQVKTLNDSQARLDLATGTIVRLGPNTLFTLEVQQDGDAGLFTRIWMDVGKVWIILNGGTLEIETPSGLAAVRGSYMSVEYWPESEDMTLTCLEGHCSMQNEMGKMDMIAGEACDIEAPGEVPHGRMMNDTEVDEWLGMNPEATMMVPVMEATVAAMPPKPADTDDDTDSPNSVKPTITKTVKLNPTFTFTPQTTPQTEATPLPGPAVTLLRTTECRVGPGTKYPLVGNIAAGWTVPLVGRGTDGSWIVRYPYQTSIACWIPASAATPNQTAYNVPIYNPPPLQNITPTKDVESTKTTEPDITKTPTATEPTKTPTITNTPAPNSPPTVSSASGPTGLLTVCSNGFSVTATDPDGIASVKVQYAINDSSFASPRYAGPLSTVSGNTYSGSLTLSGSVINDMVYWRFIVKDTRGMFSYSYPYSYEDKVGCP